MAKWGILAATILGLFGVDILRLRGGSVDLRWKDSGLSYSVTPPEPNPG